MWVKRDNGQYWPSIVQSFDCESITITSIDHNGSSPTYLLPAATSALIRHSLPDDGAHKVFVGLGSGQIMVSKDDLHSSQHDAC